MKPGLSPIQITLLEVAFEAMLPELALREGYKQRVTEKVAMYIQSLPSYQQREVKQLLGLLNSKVLGATWRGPWSSLLHLPPEQRAALFEKWSQHDLPTIRKAFQALKKLITFAALAYDGTSNDWHSRIGYTGAKAIYQFPSAPSSMAVEKQVTKTLKADVVIVGSGAGGGIMAMVLAEAGFNVLVLEKGKDIAYDQMPMPEAQALAGMYEGGGLCTSVDGGVGLLAGSCLGGGTTVNWAASIRTPAEVLEEWSTQYANPHFTTDEFLKGFEWVEKKTHVQFQCDEHNFQNKVIEESSKHLGWKSRVIPRNVHPDKTVASVAFASDSFSTHGDRFARKQGSKETFLLSAQAAGAKILAECKVEKINIAHGKATTLDAILQINGTKKSIQIECNHVVLCAGALHTPALLQRSGIHHHELGKNLYLHPTTGVAGIYQEESIPWTGPMMSQMVEYFTNMEQGYGFRIETPPLHPGLLALAMPWANARQFEHDFLKARNMAVNIVLTRDKFGGSVQINKKGELKIKYKLHPFDKKHLVKGVQESTRMHMTAGAQTVKVLHQDMPQWKKGDITESFLRSLPSLKWSIHRFPLFSAHQMGTCRMSGNKKMGVVRPDGQLWGYQNIWIADGSVFPSASGANPMLSIQATAYWIARQFVAKNRL